MARIIKEAGVPRLNVVEPTLHDQTGHCYSYVMGLLRGNRALLAPFSITVWHQKNSSVRFKESQPFFSRHFRQIQKVFLYLRLMKKKESLYIATAQSWDVRVIYWCLKYHLYMRRECRTVFLHFHQFSSKPKKIEFLQRVSAQQLPIVILTPTERLQSVFQQLGFSAVKQVPCFSHEPSAPVPSPTSGFKKLLYAGSARADKGFSAIVSLMEYCQINAPELAFELQISPPSKDCYDDTTEMALKKMAVLQQVAKTPVTTHTNTLNQAQYQALFSDGICLLLYDPIAYAGKFSGVALDALCAGMPIVATRGTWMADRVQEFEAGLVVDDTAPKSVLAAIRNIMTHFSHYQRNALLAAEVLIKRHHPVHTLSVVRSYFS